MGVLTYNLHGQMTVWPGDNLLYQCSTYELVRHYMGDDELDHITVDYYHLL
jgi:hypothetical protein